MKINSLQLQNFKNYSELRVDFSSKINLITGLNGQGKTNLLDAIHMLAFTKSAFATSDAACIRHDQPFFSLQAVFEEDQKEIKVNGYLETGKRKQLKVDQKDMTRPIDHIGKIPAVLSTPYDIDLIRDPGETRRKWVDGSISQLNPAYLKDLLDYQRTLKQRTTFLKQLEVINDSAADLLDTYDSQLIELSIRLAEERQKFTNDFLPNFQENHKLIVSEEHCDLSYETEVLTKSFPQEFRAGRHKDLVTGRTLMGCHRDDFLFTIDGHMIRKLGSQGQQKSFVLALRFAQYDYLHRKTGKKPILLLDDLFDKLDDERILRILDVLNDDERFGQVLITDARKDRAVAYRDSFRDIALFELKEGQLLTI